MELTPQQLCEVEFSEQWRGYSRDQVDDFIERVAAAVSTLQDRLRKMTERAVRAEQRALECSEADGAARRTLVLAQRTADATMAEAKDTAARLVAQAQEEARAMILAAESRANELDEAEPTPRLTARAEIADLEVTKSRLQADVAALEAHVSDRRGRIKDLLDELQRRVDEGLEGRIAQWPSFDDTRLLTDELAPFDDDEAYDSRAGVIEAQLAPEPALEPDEDALGDDTLAHAFEEADDDEEEELEPAPSSEWEPFVEDVAPVVAAPSPPEAGHDDEAPDDPDDAYEDRVEPVPLAARGDFPDHDVDDETYFAHLRGALDDDAPLGPRDDLGGMLQWRDDARTAVAEVPRLYDQGEPGSRKFGLRKRRQRRRD